MRNLQDFSITDRNLEYLISCNSDNYIEFFQKHVPNKFLITCEMSNYFIKNRTLYFFSFGDKILDEKCPNFMVYTMSDWFKKEFL